MASVCIIGERSQFTHDPGPECKRLVTTAKQSTVRFAGAANNEASATGVCGTVLFGNWLHHQNCVLHPFCVVVRPLAPAKGKPRTIGRHHERPVFPRFRPADVYSPIVGGDESRMAYRRNTLGKLALHCGAMARRDEYECRSPSCST